MIKVNLVGSLNSVEFVNLLEKNGIVFNGGVGFDLEKVLKEKGNGVYEFSIGCMGSVDEIELNDEYMSLEEINKEYVGDFEDGEYDGEFYGEIEGFWNDLNDNEKNSVLCIGYFEEDYSLFVNIKNS
jgi:hypothetical protein